MTEKDLLTALGPLAALYDDPAVLEIMVDAPERVLVERQGKLEDAGVRFASPEDLRKVIDAVLALAGVQFYPEQTIADARLADGTRVLVVLPPTAVEGPYVVMRKLPAPVLTWDKLIEFGSINQEALDVLRSAVHTRQNMLIAGGTGSGKTTLMNMIAELVPADQRLVVIHGAYELHIRHSRVVPLVVGDPAVLSMADLITTASKMRPDWLVIGELLGAEAMRAVEIFGRGHSGMATLHANNAEDALSRLEAMCLMANLGLGMGEIRSMIASALQLVTYQERLPDGSRKLTQIVELCGLDNGRYVLQPLFRYSPQSGKLKATGTKPTWERDAN
jgi:pilus assembly protein CpaF